MPLAQGLRVRLFDANLSSPTLIEDLTDRLTTFTFTTRIHGGFERAKGTISMSLEEAWQWLSSPELPGRFFFRLLVSREQDVIWEGRVMEIRLIVGGFQLRQSAADLRNAITPLVGSTEGTVVTNSDSLSSYPRRELLLTLPAGSNANTQADAATLASNERGDPKQSQEFQVGAQGRLAQGIDFTALGYWSSCRDQYYSDDDAGNTDWTTSGAHSLDKIVKEILTEECPDINSDQANIDTISRDLVGIDLSGRKYAQAWIVDLMSVGDSDFGLPYFAIWEDRKPYLRKRSIATLDWRVFLRDPSRIWQAISRDAGGDLAEKPMYYVRGGDTIRVDDLVPASLLSPALDNQRTFWLRGTSYDAMKDVLTLQPDTPTRGLASILPRLGQVERNQ